MKKPIDAGRPYDEVIQILAKAVRSLGAKKPLTSSLTPLDVAPRLRLHGDEKRGD